MKINHNVIQISIDPDGMHDGEKYQAEQAIRLCIDLYKEGRLKYMDLEAKQDYSVWFNEAAEIPKEVWDELKVILERRDADTTKQVGPSVRTTINDGVLGHEESTTYHRVGYKP